MKKAAAAVDAEIKATMKLGEEVEELDAEQKRGRGLPAGPARAEGVEDDDKLFEDEEDLALLEARDLRAPPPLQFVELQRLPPQSHASELPQQT